jgi:hypothetical protein
VHNGFNNFYNEPPFADRLAGLAAQYRVPESAQYEFVEAVKPRAASASFSKFKYSVVNVDHDKNNSGFTTTNRSGSLNIIQHVRPFGRSG